MEEEDTREKRVRAMTRIFYSRPEVQEAIAKFGKNREVVPRYFEAFGKRPDTIGYPSDILSLVKKGATSFHCSEEIWKDPLSIESDMNQKEANELRTGWDLLIDIDSKYLDVSKILAKLIVEKLENLGVKNYGIKFSGSKGFHLIVSSKAFPREFDGKKTNEMFPEWPRAICEYLMQITRREFNKSVGRIFENEGALKRVDEKKNKEALCPECGRAARKGSLVVLECPVCHTTIQRKDMKLTKRRLKCIGENCAGVLEIKEQKDYFQCSYCDNVSSISKTETSGRYATTFTEHAKNSEDYSKELKEEFAGANFGAADLVLVAPRHLFRMPYSLHEKTALASVVLEKGDIEGFLPKDANPMSVKIKEYMPNNLEGEARGLLSEALEWKKNKDSKEKEIEGKRYSEDKVYEEVDFTGVSEDMFPPAIKKLLLGLEDGKKRGLFILITFLRSLNFSQEFVNKRVREWNEKNKPPLKEGYVRSQIEWHFKQKKKILPPNYSNEAFYKDLGLLTEIPKTKNPIVDVKNILWKRGRS
jgi:hypothetical protein